ncbi:MAG: hypothetical protein UT30_C0024G0008 [Candidatus Uhrbacteria bacterium GW2011_GWF2_39_13]|uniref:Uncharacterized protein n=1 Tax=Candidatus Uhrbacteria bacterium GW2011_GWF2_39_13 TaxID=1618995 RepID=A0A0G0MKF9_9BACT|nr:MAG: hypothetical protein UT30_C0024G0008 [Candidatus Uhrbacteria bacterium GW2011_GWF2_39_13]
MEKSAKRNFNVIDAHAHPDWHLHNFDKTLANMELCDISKAWLLSCESPSDEVNHNVLFNTHGFSSVSEKGPISFFRCLYYKERTPKFILGHVPDPASRRQ